MIYHVDRLNAQIIYEGPHGEDNSPPPRQNLPYGKDKIDFEVEVVCFMASK